jgi:hypothetical protein
MGSSGPPRLKSFEVHEQMDSSSATKAASVRPTRNWGATLRQAKPRSLALLGMTGGQVWKDQRQRTGVSVPHDSGGSLRRYGPQKKPAQAELERGTCLYQADEPAGG